MYAHVDNASALEAAEAVASNGFYVGYVVVDEGALFDAGGQHFVLRCGGGISVAGGADGAPLLRETDELLSLA